MSQLREQEQEYSELLDKAYILKQKYGAMAMLLTEFIEFTI